MKPATDKLTIKHKKNCGSVRCTKEKTWSSPWTFEKMEWLNIWAKPNGLRHYRWFSFRCNSTDCPAILLVNQDVVIKQFVGSYYFQEQGK